MAVPLRSWSRPAPLVLRHRMGSGSMSQSPVSASALAEIRRNVDSAINALAVQVDLVAMEAGLLSPGALDADVSAAMAIPMAEGLSSPELRALVYSDAQMLAGIADGIKTGPTSSYLTAEQKAVLDSIVTKALGTRSLVKSYGLMSNIFSDNKRAAEDHNAMHAEEVLQFVREAEKAVVSAEAGPGGRVPVLEPYERGEMTDKVILVAAAAAVISAVVYFS